MSTKITREDWEEVISAAARLQGIIPDAVLVGGTAVALYAEHRFSIDADHVFKDLKTRFDDVLHQLDEVAGWKTARTNAPVQILGSLNGVQTGLRQLIRNAPLETREFPTKYGRITIPTEEELLRIKGLLIVKRNATRDYVDFAALASRLDKNRIITALLRMNDLYDNIPKTVGTPIENLLRSLSDPKPNDLNQEELKGYKGISKEFSEWENVRQICLTSATEVALVMSSLGMNEGPK